MTTFLEVDPETLISVSNKTPANGRGAWTREGIGYDSQYVLAPAGSTLVGAEAEKSLAHWAVSAAVAAIQHRLRVLNFIQRGEFQQGEFNDVTHAGVKTFQSQNKDPNGLAALYVDGKVGPATARALFLPVIQSAEARFSIPRSYLLGQTYHESGGDPGAIGYYIFYGDAGEYRGVDRGFSQINSKAHPEETWNAVYRPSYALDYSADRLRTTFNTYISAYPIGAVTAWKAALASHNSPLWGRQWAETGQAPNDKIAQYVQSVLDARF